MEGIGPQYEALGMLGACNLVEDVKTACKANEFMQPFTAWIESLPVPRPLLLPNVM